MANVTVIMLIAVNHVFEFESQRDTPKLIKRIANMNDSQIEKEIQDKGLTAPRITPKDIESAIVKEQFHVFEGSTFTSCLLTLTNGFTVHGESACASVENFDVELGKKIARDNAKNKIWMLEGYLLRQKLHDAS